MKTCQRSTKRRSDFWLNTLTEGNEPRIGGHLGSAIRVGLISDTHDLLRPQAIDFLRGSDVIIHAGDICDPTIIEELARIAPVTAVRGNNDVGAWARRLPETELVKIGGIYIYVIHDLAQLDIDPIAAGVQVVISGHSHKPGIEQRDGVVFVNSGSAGPRRFKLPISVAELVIAGGSLSARLVELTNK
jgi:putative phosphoesterase